MAEYSFVTTWTFPAPRAQVWRALNTPDRYPEWWPNILSYQDLTPELKGVGAQAERVVRGRLPYQLRYRTVTTEIVPLSVLAYDASGDLTGKGRFVLKDLPDGTEVVFYWDVRTTGRLMNWLAPAFKWLFAWNHNDVMNNGQKGLAAWLAQGEPRDPT